MNSQTPAINLRLGRILETSLYADDLDQAEAFYQSVLGLAVFAKETGRHIFFKLGDQILLIFNPAKTTGIFESVPHGACGPGHVAFAVTMSGLDGWKARLRDKGVKIEKEIDWPGGGRSLYFRDPAGNCLELASPLIWRMPDETSPPKIA